MVSTKYVIWKQLPSTYICLLRNTNQHTTLACPCWPGTSVGHPPPPPPTPTGNKKRVACPVLGYCRREECRYLVVTLVWCSRPCTPSIMPWNSISRDQEGRQEGDDTKAETFCCSGLALSVDELNQYKDSKLLLHAVKTCTKSDRCAGKCIS